MGPYSSRLFVWLGTLAGVAVLALVLSYVAFEWLIGPQVSGDQAAGEQGSDYASQLDLEQFEQFDEFSIYWLGDSFQDLPLKAMLVTHDKGIRGYEDITANDIVLVDYGGCEKGFGQVGCPIPLSLNIQPYCARPPEIIHNQVKTGPPIDIRGATVQWTGDDVILWTNDVAISVTGTDRTVIEEAVRNLIAVTPGGPKSASEDLGPPLEVTCPSLPYATGQPVEDAELEP